MLNVDRIHAIKRPMIERCVGLCANDKNVNRMIIFGSSITDQCREQSDVDICLSTTYDIRSGNLSKLFSSLNKICGYNCDILLYERLGERLKNEIDKKGVTVYELS